MRALTLLACSLFFLIACGELPPPETVQSDHPVGESVPGSVVGFTGSLRNGMLLYQTSTADAYGLADAADPNHCQNLPAYFSGAVGMVTRLVDGAVVPVQQDVGWTMPQPGQLVYLSTMSGLAALTRPVELGNTIVQIGTIERVPPGYDSRIYGAALQIQIRLRWLGVVGP